MKKQIEKPSQPDLLNQSAELTSIPGKVPMQVRRVGRNNHFVRPVPNNTTREELSPEELYDMDNADPEELEIVSNNQQSSRNSEHSLATFAKRFLELLRSSPNGELNIKFATKQMGLRKRRLYDITNVLEGIGWVQRVKKNFVRLVGSPVQQTQKLESEIQQLHIRAGSLRLANERIDHELKSAREIVENFEKQYEGDLKYISSEDFRNIAEKLAGTLEDEILVVQANDQQTDPTSAHLREEQQPAHQLLVDLSGGFKVLEAELTGNSNLDRTAGYDASPKRSARKNQGGPRTE